MRRLLSTLDPAAPLRVDGGGGPVWLFGAGHGARGRARAVGVHRHVRAGGRADLPRARARGRRARDRELRAAGVRAGGLHRGAARRCSRSACCGPGTNRPVWEPVAVTLFGICYVNWLLGYAFWLRDLEAGREWILLLVCGHVARGDRGVPGRLDAGPPQARPRDQPPQDGGGRGRAARDVGARRAGRARDVLPGALARGRGRGRAPPRRGRARSAISWSPPSSAASAPRTPGSSSPATAGCSTASTACSSTRRCSSTTRRTRGPWAHEAADRARGDRLGGAAHARAGGAFPRTSSGWRAWRPAAPIPSCSPSSAAVTGPRALALADAAAVDAVARALRPAAPRAPRAAPRAS